MPTRRHPGAGRKRGAFFSRTTSTSARLLHDFGRDPAVPKDSHPDRVPPRGVPTLLGVTAPGAVAGSPCRVEVRTRGRRCTSRTARASLLESAPAADVRPPGATVASPAAPNPSPCPFAASHPMNRIMNRIMNRTMLPSNAEAVPSHTAPRSLAVRAAGRAEERRRRSDQRDDGMGEGEGRGATDACCHVDDPSVQGSSAGPSEASCPVDRTWHTHGQSHRRNARGSMLAFFPWEPLPVCVSNGAFHRARASSAPPQRGDHDQPRREQTRWTACGGPRAARGRAMSSVATSPARAAAASSTASATARSRTRRRKRLTNRSRGKHAIHAPTAAAVGVFLCRDVCVIFVKSRPMGAPRSRAP